jgi:hypothetical protein
VTFRHIVLFRIRDGVAEDDIEGAQAGLRALGVFPEIIEWRVERSLDARKGVVLVEEATFVDEAGFLRWRERAAHQDAAAQLARIADWWIGDYAI